MCVCVCVCVCLCVCVSVCVSMYGSLSTWPRGGLKCPGLGLTCVGHPSGHLAFLGWCGSLVLGSLWACGVQSSR